MVTSVQFSCDIVLHLFLHFFFFFFQTRGSIIVREKDDGDVLSTAAFREIAHLDELIRTFTFTSNYTDYSYSHVCQTWLHACHDNMLMSILRHQVEAMDHINLTFPFLPLPPPHEGRVFVGSQLGGVDLYPGTDVIEMARAMLLIYSVTRETREAEELAYEWEEHFIQEVKTLFSE